ATIAATSRVGAMTGAQAKLAASQPPRTRATPGGGMDLGSLIGTPTPAFLRLPSQFGQAQRARPCETKPYANTNRRGEHDADGRVKIIPLGGRGENPDR